MNSDNLALAPDVEEYAPAAPLRPTVVSPRYRFAEPAILNSNSICPSPKIICSLEIRETRPPPPVFSIELSVVEYTPEPIGSAHVIASGGRGVISTSKSTTVN